MNHTSLAAIANLVGNTPLLEIYFTYKGKERRLFAKAENFNMTGSIKDRMAFYILRKAYEMKLIKHADTVIEATSGNTGISFAAISKTLGHLVRIYMPDWMSDERKNLIRSFGAEIILVSKEQGGFLGSISMAEEFAKNNSNSFLPRQFSNEDNVMAHYESTGPEIWWQLKFASLTPDAFVAGVGTGGTIMGVGKFLKEKTPSIKLHPLEPSNSPTLRTGYKVGKHRIQGISDEFIPSIVKLNELDQIVDADDGDSIIMARKLSSELGIGVGISSGANFIGALKVLEEMGGNAVVATVFPDDNKKYLSTDLMRDEQVKSDFISKDIKLLGVTVHKRVCQTCCTKESCNEKRFNIENEGQRTF